AATQGSGQAATAPAAPAVDLNATLKAGVKADIGDLDPQSIAGVAGITNTQNHFIGALAVDATRGEPKPYAADWQWQDGGQRPQLPAKPGVTFPNGEPLTAEQLKFNFDRILGTAEYNAKFTSSRKSLLAAVGEIRVVDERTVRLEMARPDVGL